MKLYRFISLELLIILSDEFVERHGYLKMAETQKKVRWWHIALVVVTLLAALPKIYIGLDHDESYIVTMGIRLLNGDRIFDTMWELHMTSAWPAFLGLALFRFVTGSLEGAVVFLRALSTMLQFATGWIAYRIFDKYGSRDAAVLSGVFIANFLPRATQNLEYGLLEMLFVVLAVLLLYDEYKGLRQGKGKSILRMICAGVLYALGVLAYPTIILSFPVLLIALFVLSEEESGRWKRPALFAVTCEVCAIIFLIYVFSYLPPEQFLVNLQGILSDGMHSDLDMTGDYLRQLMELAKRAVMIGIAAVACHLISYKWEKKELLWYDIMLAGTIVFVGFNVTGLRPSGPIGLQIRYILAAIAAIYFAKKQRARVETWLFILPGLAIYAGAMTGSNMGLEENASFLYLTVLAAVWLMAEYAKAHAEHFERIGVLCMACFVCGVIFCKGALVRVTGTGPANIAQERVPVETGILQGIYVYSEETERYEQSEREIGAYATEDDTILYIGDEAVCNTFAPGAFTSATCISTPVYNKEWVMYFENEEHPFPTVVFVDKYAVKTPEEFTETEFGEWLLKHCKRTEEDFVEEEAFYILRLSE